MARVDPGELKWEITILIPVRSVDENNHYVLNEPRRITTRAAVRAVKSQDDAYAAGAERMRETLQFIVRWRTGIDTSAAVEFKGRRYELEYVDPTPFAGGYMRLKGVSYDAGVGEVV